MTHVQPSPAPGRSAPQEGRPRAGGGAAKRGGDRRPARSPRRILRGLGPYLFVAPALIFLAALVVYPIFLNIVMSFQDRTLANLVDGSAPWVGTANYDVAFSTPSFRAAAVHSVVATLVAVSCQLVIGLGLALFYFRQFPGARVLRSMFLITYAIPMVVSAQVFRWMLDGRGLVNWALQGLGLSSDPTFWLSDLTLALPALIVIQIWLGVPFTMVNILAGLTTIPRDLHDAAAIDGATAWQRFRDITWPLLRPTVLASAVLSLIFWFKTFDLVWITTQGGPGTATEILPTLAYRTAFIDFNFGQGAAILNLVFLACFVLSLLYIFSLRREARYA